MKTRDYAGREMRSYLGSGGLVHEGYKDNGALWLACNVAKRTMEDADTTEITCLGCLANPNHIRNWRDMFVYVGGENDS